MKTIKNLFEGQAYESETVFTREDIQIEMQEIINSRLTKLNEEIAECDERDKELQAMPECNSDIVEKSTEELANNVRTFTLLGARDELIRLKG